MKHSKNTEIIKSHNPLQERFSTSNNELFRAVMDVLVSDIKYLEKNYGKSHKLYKNKLNMFSALSKYQSDVMRYIDCLEHEVINQSGKTKIMASGYRKAADMKINEIVNLTSEEIAKISTLSATGNNKSSKEI